MSHIATIELHIKSLEALRRAAARLGLEFVEGQETYRWYGRRVGSDPLPEGFTVNDLGRCAHAIRIPGNDVAYEIGVVPRRDGQPGYQLMWDFWQGGYGMQDRVGPDAGLLRQAYATEESLDWAYEQGYQVSETKRPDGTVVLEAYR